MRRFLFVDPDPDMRALYATFAARHGLPADIAAGLPEALRLGEGIHYTAAVVELMLRCADGLELIERLHAMQPHIRCVLATGHTHLIVTDEEPVARSIEGVLYKPFTLEQLARWITPCARGRRPPPARRPERGAVRTPASVPRSLIRATG